MKGTKPQQHDELSIALFDVDGTLLKGSSSFAASWFLLQRRMIGPQHILLALWYAMLHGLGLATYERMYRIGLKLFQGMAVDEVLRLSRQCLEERVESRFFVGALQEIETQRDLGREIVLVSAGPRYLVQVIGEWLGADAVITAGPLIESGRVTDVLDGQVCSGQGKIQRVVEYLSKRGVAVEDCCYYGDSINDLPLLNVVGQPIASNPDPRLRKVAVSKGWKILSFAETIGTNRSSTRAATVSSALANASIEDDKKGG